MVLEIILWVIPVETQMWALHCSLNVNIICCFQKPDYGSWSPLTENKILWHYNTSSRFLITVCHVRRRVLILSYMVNKSNEKHDNKQSNDDLLTDMKDRVWGLIACRSHLLLLVIRWSRKSEVVIPAETKTGSTFRTQCCIKMHTLWFISYSAPMNDVMYLS